MSVDQRPMFQIPIVSPFIRILQQKTRLTVNKYKEGKYKQGKCKQDKSKHLVTAGWLVLLPLIVQHPVPHLAPSPVFPIHKTSDLKKSDFENRVLEPGASDFNKSDLGNTESGFSKDSDKISKDPQDSHDQIPAHDQDIHMK